jgi:nucleotide-binding universal stress UspA family protein
MVRTDEPVRHVGIAYDGSAEARIALDAGYAIARAAGAAVTVAYAQGFVGPEAADLALRERLRAQHLLDDAADSAPAEVNPQTLLLHGPAPGVIARACEGVIDLLVCGSRGYGPIERALMGSVAEGLMEGAPHPVLVLPRKAAPVGAATESATAAVGA